MTDGSGTAFSTDPHLNNSINEVLAEFAEPETGASDPTQDGASVESPREIPEPSPGDQGQQDTPDVSEPATPVAGQPATPEPVEPEPQYEPFTYAVNGESRTLEGSFRIPGEGLFVPEAQVPRWQQIASRAEANEIALRTAHEESQTWGRLTTWQVPGPNGQPQTLTGRPAYEAQRVALDQLAAVVQTYRTYLSDPAKLASLLIADTNGQVVFDPTVRRVLDLEVKDAARDAESRIRTWLAQQGGQIAARASEPDAPVIPSEAIKGKEEPILSAKIAEWGIKNLTQDDVKTLAPQLRRYVRVASAEDVRNDPGLRLGQMVLENEFESVVRLFAASRAGGATAAQAKAQADKFNRGQQNGRAGQPPARPAPPVAPQPTPQPDRKRRSRNERSGPSWDDILAHGMADPEVQAAMSGNG